jgi:putative IMPACT (imprinted ancient) family translation regulator
VINFRQKTYKTHMKDSPFLTKFFHTHNLRSTNFLLPNYKAQHEHLYYLDKFIFGISDFRC